MSEDFMPLDGWDHVELWVGNAKQAAYYYENAFGFRRTAYAGPETGVRDRASYVLEQNDIRFVLTSAMHPEHEISQHAYKHGDGVKDIALRVPDAAHAYDEAVSRGARGVAEPTVQEDEFGRVELATIATYGDVVDTVEALQGRGVIFLTTPEAYYDETPDRVGEIDESWDDLRRLRILADRDDDGYLLQIFTKTAQDRPTLFFEVIERHGARGFGDGNFKALFEAIEREQALRGNL